MRVIVPLAPPIIQYLPTPMSSMKSNVMWNDLIGLYSWLWGNNSCIGTIPGPSSLVKGLACQANDEVGKYKKIQGLDGAFLRLEN